MDNLCKDARTREKDLLAELQKQEGAKQEITVSKVENVQPVVSQAQNSQFKPQEKRVNPNQQQNNRNNNRQPNQNRNPNAQNQNKIL